MKVDVSTVLSCPAEKVWAELQTVALLQRVAWPLARLTPVGNTCFPLRWVEGMTFRCRLYIFGFIPIGARTLHVERLDQNKREMQTREHDPLVRTWDHLISVAASGAEETLYRDQIEIDAGALTFVVWAWANWFYRHRQSRWRAIARSL
jgi:ligand-binding SRPBCC domain-containing protein